MGIMGNIQGLHRDNGKEHRNYYIIVLYRDYILKLRSSEAWVYGLWFGVSSNVVGVKIRLGFRV